MKNIAAIFVLIFVIGCASNQNVDESNKSATFWYQEMLKQIKIGNLERADGNFASLQSEHLNSPLLPDAMLILAKAHAGDKEFALSDYYLDEYLKRFGTENNRDYILFLKVQNHFFAFVNASKDQSFLTSSLNEVSDFIEDFPKSRYLEMAKTIKLRLELAQNELNAQIASVYEKSNKIEASKYYDGKIDKKLNAETKPTKTHIPWYVKMFSW
ncbi:MAG: outer membrane protein assembly factor BamD [Helicobacter sp.]|nr:outer membrane protein assembly factor BamD [Helicobacter sp.]